MKLTHMFPILVSLAVAAVLASGYFGYGYDWKVLGFPFGLGVVCIALAGLSLVGDIRTVPRSDEARRKESLLDESEGLLENPRTWLELGWLAIFSAAAYVLGFLVGPGVTIAAYYRFNGHSWLVSVAIGVLVALGIWLIFITILRTPLPVMPIFMR